MKTFLFTAIALCSLLLMPQDASAQRTGTIKAQVLEIGSRVSNDNQTFYVKLDQKVGPSQCFDDLLKIDLKRPQRENAERAVQQILLTALVSGLPVKLLVLDTCLYGNPTFSVAWIVRS
jgi:hypothetical protein